MFDLVWRFGLLAAAFSLGPAAPVAAGLGGGETATETAKRIGHATLTHIRVNGRKAEAVVGPGRNVTVKFDVRTDSSAWCPKCTNQIVVGYARQTRHGLERLAGGRCIFSASGPRWRQNLSVKLRAPDDPGSYRIIVSAPQAYNCVSALKWRGKPAAIAALKVR